MRRPTSGVGSLCTFSPKEEKSMSETAAPGTEAKITTHDHFIDGKLVAGTSGCYGKIYNPATGAVTARVALASRSEVEQAILCAQKAFPAWRGTPPAKRAQVMFRLKGLLESHADTICALITAEHGKVARRCRGRAAARHRKRRVRLRRPRTPQGRAQPRRRPGHRFVERVSAARGHRRDHALQLPGHGARCGCGRWPWRAATPSFSNLPSATRRAPCTSPSWPPRPACRRGCSTWSTATRRRWTPCSTDPRVQAVSFVGSTAVAEVIYSDRRRQRQAGAGARGRQEPRRRHARCRHGQRRQRPDGGGVRLLRRALHGDLGGGGGGG